MILIMANSSGEELLDSISTRYSSAAGIQWQVRSVVYSEIFEEADTSLVRFMYSPPDTFSLVSDREKIIGIGDTLWVLSERHRQIQKKTMDSALLPYNFIINWSQSYDIESYSREGSENRFDLRSKESISPDYLVLSADKKQRIRSISYVDSKGDEVTMSFLEEQLNRPDKFDFFFQQIPDGFEFIDLTE